MIRSVRDSFRILAHPGGNITGFSFIEPEMVGKWINLLRDVKPNLSRVALMFNPDTVPYFDVYLRSFNALPQQTSVEAEAAHVRSAAEVESAIAKLGREPGSALIAASDGFHPRYAWSDLESGRSAPGAGYFPL